MDFVDLTSNRDHFDAVAKPAASDIGGILDKYKMSAAGAITVLLWVASALAKSRNISMEKVVESLELLWFGPPEDEKQ